MAWTSNRDRHMYYMSGWKIKTNQGKRESQDDDSFEDLDLSSSIMRDLTPV